MSNERQGKSIDWQSVRTDYESGQFSQSALERKYGVSRQAIKKHAAKEHWVTPTTKVTVTPAKQGVPNRDTDAALQVVEALRFRARKHTYQQIAQECGYSDAGTCRRAIMRELDRIVADEVDELRREEAFTLDRWQEECSELFFDKSNKGRLFALDRLLAISERRAKLMGLDVPVKGNESTTTVIIRETPPSYFGEEKQ